MTVTDSSPTRLVGADRVLAVLKELALQPQGVSLEDLTKVIGSPKPTVHRALAALRRADLADRDAHGHYRLGDEFLRMAFSHHEARPDHIRVQPVLDLLVARFGESVHYSVLEGREVVYRAKVDPQQGAVRLTSNVGGRNPAHATAVGKLLLAYQLRSREEVAEWMGATGLVRRTPSTRVTLESLHADLQQTRERGYATDEQENESGVNCIALPVFATSPVTPSGAVSISGLTYRTPLRTLVDSVDEIRKLMGGMCGVPR